MCGRYVLTTDDYASVADALEAAYDGADAAAHRPRFNVAPTDVMPIVRSTDVERRRLVQAKWGLVAPRDAASARPPVHINARAETLGERPLFRHAFAHLRIGVVADGFYEWVGTKKQRTPIRFHRPDGGPIVFAGIASARADAATGAPQLRFAIVTTTPTAVVAPVHDRMPVILEGADLDAWIGPAPGGVASADWLDALRALLRPVADGVLVATPASPRANDVRNDDPDCLVAPPSLFDAPPTGPPAAHET